jgi:hypothetical protein
MIHNVAQVQPVQQRGAEPIRPNVQLHIQELILHGFAPGDRFEVMAAVERELSRLVNETGTAAGIKASKEVRQLEGGAFEVQPGARADAIGAQVARQIFRGLNGLSETQTPGAKRR